MIDSNAKLRSIQMPFCTEGETVSKERALQELSRHCVPETDFEEFFSDMGVKEQYDAQEVLLWLGY
ncbi:hypothetical protein HRL93_004170 [Salmonella enterica]|nr:hypothetical protein [Salmonella enterica]EFV1749197.1 hypothetical protein [Salmonella enterica]